MIEDGENPYASPELAPDPAPESRVQTLKWLRGAAIGMMFFAGFHIICAGFWLFALPIAIGIRLLYPKLVDMPAWQLTLLWLGVILVLVRAVYMMKGAMHIRTAKNYRWARLGAILASVGVFVPYFWWEAPFGVWAWVLLRKEKYKNLFEIGPN